MVVYYPFNRGIQPATLNDCIRNSHRRYKKNTIDLPKDNPTYVKILKSFVTVPSTILYTNHKRVGINIYRSLSQLLN
jgi:hypothetical protein